MGLGWGLGFRNQASGCKLRGTVAWDVHGHTRYMGHVGRMENQMEKLKMKRGN